MAFKTLKGAREGLTHNSEEYKKKVIVYMQTRGYLLASDSANDSTLSDLVFKEPYTEGNKEIWVEAKYTDVSLKDSSLLSELGGYFLAYIQKNKKFKLLIFAKKCKNQENWKKLFELGSQDKDRAKSLWDDIAAALTSDKQQLFEINNFDDFILFLADVEVIECNFEDLIRNIDELEENKKFCIQNQFLQDLSTIKNTQEVITSNISRVTKSPKEIWVSELKKEIDADFWKVMRGSIGISYKAVLYTLKPIDSSSELSTYLDIESSKKIDVENLSEDKQINENLLKNLIKQQLILKGQERGFRYDRILDCLFFNNPKQIPEYLKKGRIVAKTYRKDGKVNFVKHTGIHFYVEFFDDSFHVIFNLVTLFTNDGKEILRGDAAQKLHYLFTKRFSYNNSEKSQLLYFIDLLGIGNQAFSDDGYWFSPLLKTISTVSFSGGEPFDVTILDYIKEDTDGA